MKKKTVGIITMHRPISFGSSLQAFALQKKIQDLGCDCEIIDYQYPNEQHLPKRSVNWWIKLVVHYMLNLLMGLPCVVESHRFKMFRKKHLILSKYYKDADALIAEPPRYDIYCTGSDQVWNTNFIKDDNSFLLSFVNNVTKVSYSSSFAVDYVKDEFKVNFKKYLSQYKAISVREQSGISLVKELTGKDAKLVCDPTLLLSEEEWLPLIAESKIKISRPYLLVFILTYSFNPYPEVNRIIEAVQKNLGLHTVVLNGNKYDYMRKDTTVIKNAGPCEFLQLIHDASFVITSSFHGVAFSVNFSKQFIAVVKNSNHDSRLVNFLEILHLQDHILEYNSLQNINVNLSSPDRLKINEYRQKSLNYLKQIIA